MLRSKSCTSQRGEPHPGSPPVLASVCTSDRLTFPSNHSSVRLIECMPLTCNFGDFFTLCTSSCLWGNRLPKGRHSQLLFHSFLKLQFPSSCRPRPPCGAR